MRSRIRLKKSETADKSDEMDMLAPAGAQPLRFLSLKQQAVFMLSWGLSPQLSMT
jgi:hypothetical protein